MKLRISFYAESSDPHPQILANPTGDFESLTDARETAFEDANKPDVRAHSIIIGYWSRGAVARDERLGGAVAHPTLLHRGVVDGLDDDRVCPHVRLVGILERRLA